MLEQSVEQHLRKRVIAAGGMCRKWVCPGHSGAPDRIVVLNKQIWFIELKRPGGKSSRLQREFQSELRKQDCNVIAIDCKELVNDFIDTIAGM